MISQTQRNTHSYAAKKIYENITSNFSHRKSAIGGSDDINAVQKLKLSPFYRDILQPSARAIGPIAIVGATSSIYSAALSHSSSTLTPSAVLYLVLLAMNYSIMPRLSKKYIHPNTNKQSLALVEEAVKFTMGIGGFVLSTKSYHFKDWTIGSSLVAAGFPSMLYAVQGVLTYTAYQNLDSLTFNGLTQMKTLSAAFCCYLLLNKRQSPLQFLALVILSITPIVFQDISILSRKTSKGSSSLKSEAYYDSFRTKFFWGIVPCLGATFLSGLAGAFSQKALQTVIQGCSHLHLNPYFYSAEISFFSALCLLGSSLIQRMKQPFSNVSKDHYLFQYWSWRTMIPILVKASSGILTALVHKHSGSVMKGFALLLGLVFSALLQTILDEKHMTFGQIVGTFLVLLSSWLHFTNPA